MKTLRWITFIPIAATLAVTCSFVIGGLLSFRSFSQEHFFLSVVSPRGLAPQIIERLIPVALFVIVGALLAPSLERKVVAALGLLGGLCGWPFGPQYSLAQGHVFYAAGSAGTLAGCALGMFVAFSWQAKRRDKEPNQPPQPTTDSSAVSRG